MDGFDTLELPEVVSVEHLGFWISSSKSLSNPCVVQSLSISEFVVAECTSDNGTEHESAETLMKVIVEVVWSGSLSSEVVSECNPSSDYCESSSLDSSYDLEVVVDVKEVNMENLWVVLDQLNVSDSAGHVVVVLLNIV